jgi:hypothetical protein
MFRHLASRISGNKCLCKVDISTSMHGVHATVHEIGPKHTPNIIFNQMQLIESVENAYFSNGLFSFQIFKLIHLKNANFV